MYNLLPRSLESYINSTCIAYNVYALSHLFRCSNGVDNTFDCRTNGKCIIVVFAGGNNYFEELVSLSREKNLLNPFFDTRIPYLGIRVGTGNHSILRNRRSSSVICHGIHQYY